MVPGPQKIFSTFPKVQLALKMKKSEIEKVWWYQKKDPNTVFHYFDMYRGSAYKEPAKELVTMFEIFLERKYTEEEVIKGITYAGNFGRNIRDSRQCVRDQVSSKIGNERYEFQENKLMPQLRAIYEKRDIPAFSNRTRRELWYRPEIITEENLQKIINEFSSRTISVFRFKDKNGKLSLNFYSKSSNDIRDLKRIY